MDSVSDSKDFLKKPSKPSKTTPNLKFSDLEVALPKGFPSLPADWKWSYETLESPCDEIPIFISKFEDQNRHRRLDAHRVLIVIPGQGEHGGRYLHFPQFVKEEVSAVYVLDHRGHGRSGGIVGHIDSFDHYIEDLKFVVEHVQTQLRHELKKSEIHLFAHSMGGLIALQMLEHHAEDLTLASATISAPLLGITVEVPAWKKTLGNLLTHVWGSLQMDNGLEGGKLSHDPEILKARERDSLVHRKVTPRWFTEVTARMAQTMEWAGKIRHPVLVILPGEDQIVDSKVTETFFGRLKVSDKKLAKFPGFYHESFNEVGKEKAFQELCKWIKVHSHE